MKRLLFSFMITFFVFGCSGPDSDLESNEKESVGTFEEREGDEQQSTHEDYDEEIEKSNLFPDGFSMIYHNDSREFPVFFEKGLYRIPKSSYKNVNNNYIYSNKDGEIMFLVRCHPKKTAEKLILGYKGPSETGNRLSESKSFKENTRLKKGFYEASIKVERNGQIGLLSRLGEQVQIRSIFVGLKSEEEKRDGQGIAKEGDVSLPDGFNMMYRNDNEKHPINFMSGNYSLPRHQEFKNVRNGVILPEDDGKIMILVECHPKEAAERIKISYFKVKTVDHKPSEIKSFTESLQPPGGFYEASFRVKKGSKIILQSIATDKIQISSILIGLRKDN